MNIFSQLSESTLVSIIANIIMGVVSLGVAVISAWSTLKASKKQSEAEFSFKLNEERYRAYSELLLWANKCALHDTSLPLPYEYIQELNSAATRALLLTPQQHSIAIMKLVSTCVELSSNSNSCDLVDYIKQIVNLAKTLSETLREYETPSYISAPKNNKRCRGSRRSR